MLTPILIVKYAQLRDFYISNLSQKYENAVSCKMNAKGKNPDAFS